MKNNSELFKKWEEKLSEEGLPDELSPLEPPRASKGKGGVRKQSRPRLSPAELELIATISSYLANDCVISEQRKDWWWLYAQGYSTHQISEQTGKPQSTIAYTLRKIRARYVELLKNEIIKMCSSQMCSSQESN